MEGFYIDFDGVILDSQERFIEHMKTNTNLTDWINYLKSIEWYSFLRQCEQIDDSIDCLYELTKLKKLKAIVTRIHVYEEGIEKTRYLREKGIITPVYYVLQEQKKSTVIPPNKDMILIDDDVKNCKDWEQAGGSSILFDSNNQKNYKRKIKSLKEILSI